MSPYDWLTQKSKDNTLLLYWKCVIDLQIKVLLYVRSIREGNFKLHVEVLHKLLSLYFIYDFYIIGTKFPYPHNFLSKGNVSFQKSHREFSKMGLDQIHEQNNELFKRCRRASDLLNKMDDSALIRWETSSPVITRLILEFKDCLDRNEIFAESSTKHHEDSQHFHGRFSSDVNRLIKCITVNPFMQDHLTKLNNKKVIALEFVRTVIGDLKAMGEKQLATFVSDPLVVSKVPISQKIFLNKIEIWNHTDTEQLKCEVEFSPPKSALKKI